MKRLPILMIAGLTAALGACQDSRDMDANAAEAPETEPAAATVTETTAADAREHVSDAKTTLAKMQADQDLWAFTETARAVFVVPAYGQAGAVVGAEGGDGVLFVRENGTWSDPVFYDLGGVSVGAQAGVEGGEIAMLLMSQEALDQFMQENNFSLNADAGLTIVDYSAKAEANASDGDVVMWSDTEGLFGGITLSVTDINFDEEESNAYYQRDVTPQSILGGGTMEPSM